jgi:hypothetical protein
MTDKIDIENKLMFPGIIEKNEYEITKSSF